MRHTRTWHAWRARAPRCAALHTLAARLRVERKLQMSIAAGILARAQGQRDNGPAAGEAAGTQGAYAGHGLARPQQRTLHDVDEAGPGVRFLKVHVELL